MKSTMRAPSGPDAAAHLQVHDRLRPALRRDRRQVEPDELGRAAADVEDQQLRGPRRDQRRAGDHREPRLLLGPDHLEAQPGLPRRHRQEAVAVARAPAGLGGDEPGVTDPVARQLLGADLERGERSPDRAARQMPAPLEPRPEPDRLGKGVDDTKPAAVRRRDQHAAAVRAQVEGRVERRYPAPRTRVRRPQQRQRDTFLRRPGQVMRHHRTERVPRRCPRV